MSSFKTPSQYFALSFSPMVMLKTSFLPSSFTPRIMYAAIFFTICSSRTEKWIASMKTIGYTADKGRCCHSSIWGNILFVTAVTILSLTSKPYISSTISEICLVVMPFADIAMIFCSIADMSFFRLGTICGSKSPSRSCGTSIGISP